MKLFQNIKKFIGAHKIISLIALMAIVGGGYYWWTSANGASTETRYVLSSAQKQTIITTVSGSGQVSALNQIDVKPQASGTVLSVRVVAGQSVKTGDVIARLDATTAIKAVRDAQVSLDSAKLSLQKLQEATDPLSLTQAQNALAQAQQAQDQNQSSLTKSYDDAFTAIANAFLDLPATITGLEATIYGNDYSRDQGNFSYYADLVKSYDDTVQTYEDNANATYQTARTAYNKNFLDYKAASRYSDATATETLLSETYATTKSLAEAIKSSDNFLSFVKDQLTAHNKTMPASLATHQDNLATYTNQANTNLVSLLNSINTISDTKDAITSGVGTITEKIQSLAKLQAGTDPLDLQSAQLTVKQRENSLLDAQQQLANYTIRAPFDGVVAAVNIKASDIASSGTAAATITTQQKIATVSLNEVDVAKIKVAEKVTLTFPAIDGLSISGDVAQIDTIGAVTQGVVTYNVKITFDTQDDRVKPGMSTNAAIITNIRQDVLAVPNAAIKTNTSGASYVEMLDPSVSSAAGATSAAGVTSLTPPRQQPVEIGLANDTYTEITSGLNESDLIVTRTITAATKTTTQATGSILQGTGSRAGAGIGGLGGGFGGGGARGN